MGMSATQARYLSLVAQQSNLEYQGQQINQERTILSQQVSDLYNSLLAMEVPTPPSTQDYTKVVYSGSIGATNYTFDTTNIKPGDNGKYTVTLGTDEYGDSLQKNKGYAVTEGGTEKVVGKTVTERTYKLSGADLNNLYIINSDDTLTKATINDVQVAKDSSGNVVYYTLQEGKNYFLQQAGGGETKNLPVTSPDGKDYTIAGKNAMTLEYAKDNGYITDTQYNGYINAINNANMKSSDGKTVCTPDDFYIYIDDDNRVHFALKSDVEDGNGAAATYDYIPDGKFTKDVSYNDCSLTFDPSSGRITSIDIPSTYNPDGTVASYTTMDLKASTQTDELAYEDAMAEYEYKQYLYDKEQTEINAKTEKIQAMDRNLELKLQRLDTQRTQITTEIEALEKVLNDNIEASYKTFSG